MRGWRINSSRWIDMRLPSFDSLCFSDRSEEDGGDSMGLTNEARGPFSISLFYGSVSWVSDRSRSLAILLRGSRRQEW